MINTETTMKVLQVVECSLIYHGCINFEGID